MDARLQRRVQRYGWDKAAHSYEAGWKNALSDAQAFLIGLAAARVGQHALDVACGTGLVSLPLARLVRTGGHVYATDISENMIAKIQRAAADEGLENVTAFRADAENLGDMTDASVDLVTCALGLMYVANTLISIREMARTLKPGGRMVLAVWGDRSKCGWADIFPIVDARVESDVCPLFFRLGTGETLAREMADAGLIDIETHRITSDLAYDSDREALEAAFVGGPVALAYDRFDDATRAEVHGEYLGSIASFRGADGYRIPGEFVICRGYKK